MISQFDIPVNQAIPLESALGRREAHVFRETDVLAIEAALLTQRPLLLRGEPGTGKSQLARAAAAALGRSYRAIVVDSRTEARDLRWREDAVRRLAQAQLVGALSGDDAQAAHTEMDVRRFVTPGPLWWGFNWSSACDHLKKFCAQADAADQGNGTVVLIDEIDKAESDVPNGLLEALGERRFTPSGYETPITHVDRPLIVITTNAERPLPGAFLRRCVVHELHLPKDQQALREHLVELGRAHFPMALFPDADEEILTATANMTVRDRTAGAEMGIDPLPGQAEYIDLLNAIFSTKRKASVTPQAALDRIAPYFLNKSGKLVS